MRSRLRVGFPFTSFDCDENSNRTTMKRTTMTAILNTGSNVALKFLLKTKNSTSSHRITMGVFVIAKHKAVITRSANDDRQSPDTGNPTRERGPNKMRSRLRVGFPFASFDCYEKSRVRSLVVNIAHSACSLTIPGKNTFTFAPPACH